LHLPPLDAENAKRVGHRVSRLDVENDRTRCYPAVEAGGRCRRRGGARAGGAPAPDEPIVTGGQLRRGALEQDPDAFRSAVLSAQSTSPRRHLPGQLSRGWQVQLPGRADPGASMRVRGRQSGPVRPRDAARRRCSATGGRRGRGHRRDRPIAGTRALRHGGQRRASAGIARQREGVPSMPAY
jgi:hypothetical protein